MATKPVLAIVSPLLRRDLHDPLRFFRAFTVCHLYRECIPGDMRADDWRGDERQFTSARDLRRQLAGLRPALIQGSEPTWFPAALPVCRATAALAGEFPLYFPMLENRPLPVKFGAVGGALMRRYLAWYARRAQLVYAVNAGAHANLRAAGVPEEKIKRRLYGTWGVDLDEFSPPPAPRERLVLFVGRLEAEKGVRELVQAFAQCWRQCDARLVLAGDGPLRNELAAFVAAQPELAARVSFAGMVPNREMPALFRRAWVTCVPSRTARGWAEQVGMANLQSMACGTPVITTDSGANPEMVGEAGIIVAEGDLPEQGGTESSLPQRLAAAITELFTDTANWETLSRAGRTRAEERFNARNNIMAIESELLQLLVSKG